MAERIFFNSKLGAYCEFAIAALGCTAIFLLALSIGLDRKVARVAEIMLLLSVLLSAKHIFSNRQQNWLWGLCFLFAAYMAWINHWAETSLGFTQVNHDRFSRHYVKMFLFLPVAWWMIKYPKLIPWSLAALCTGFSVSILDAGLEPFLNKLLMGKRQGLGFQNAQHGAIYSATLILAGGGMLFHAHRYVSSNNRLACMALGGVSLVLGVLGVVATQTRAIYIGLAVAVFIIALLVGLRSDRAKRLRRFSIMIGIAIISLATVFQSDFFSHRFDKEKQSLEAVLNGDHSRLKMDSIGIRIVQWQLASKLILERPLTGYGGASKEILIAGSNMPERAKNKFGHFHNSYLELAVAYGVIASLLFIGLLLMLVLWTKRAMHSTPQNLALPVFAIGWISMFAIANTFESYVMYRSGYLLMGLAGGTIYALSKRPVKRDKVRD